jgi:hypothetical protein
MPPESCQLRCPHRPLTRTGMNQRKFPTLERFRKRRRLLFPIGRQGQVGKGGVLSALAPFGLAVANKDNLGARRAHTVPKHLERVRRGIGFARAGVQG